MFALLFFGLRLILFKTVQKGSFKRDLTTQQDKGRERGGRDQWKTVYQHRGEKKNGQSEKKPAAS